MSDSDIKIYAIDNFQKDNWLALFEEMQINGNNSPEALHAWWQEEQFLIEQSIMELKELELDE